MLRILSLWTVACSRLTDFSFMGGSRRPSNDPFGSLDLTVCRLHAAFGAIIFCHHLRATNCMVWRSRLQSQVENSFCRHMCVHAINLACFSLLVCNGLFLIEVSHKELVCRMWERTNGILWKLMLRWFNTEKALNEIALCCAISLLLVQI